MNGSTCTVPDCDRTSRSSGSPYCEMHYYRLRRTGTVAARQTPKHVPATCSVDGCEENVRGNGLCSKHYSRMRRHGSTGATRPFTRTTGLCPVEDCEQPQNYNGMCKKHASRVVRHGDPHAFTHQRDRNLPRGPSNPKWAGDGVTYGGMHLRVRRIKGRVTDYPCTDCGGRARQWSYDHADPNERTSDVGAYSTDPDHYVPRCIPCHKRFDLSQTPKVDTPIDLEEVRRLYAEGVRAMPMSRRLGVNGRRIRRAFDELGLPPFPPGNSRPIKTGGSA